MTRIEKLLLIALIAIVGMLPGCGPTPPQAPLSPEAEAKARSDSGDAARDVIIQRHIQNMYSPSSQPSFSSGFQQ